MKYYIFIIISIGLCAKISAMENTLKSETTKDIEQPLSAIAISLGMVHGKITALENKAQERSKNLSATLLQMIQDLEILKSKNNELIKKIESLETKGLQLPKKSLLEKILFHRAYVFTTIGLTSISFMVGYMIGKNRII